jgi:hypothetical protein
MQTQEPVVSDAEIARRAYEIWESRGCPPGDGADNWQAAKAELVAARTRRNGSTQHRMQSWLERVRQKIADRRRQSSQRNAARV